MQRVNRTNPSVALVPAAIGSRGIPQRPQQSPASCGQDRFSTTRIAKPRSVRTTPNASSRRALRGGDPYAAWGNTVLLHPIAALVQICVVTVVVYNCSQQCLEFAVFVTGGVCSPSRNFNIVVVRGRTRTHASCIHVQDSWLVWRIWVFCVLIWGACWSICPDVLFVRVCNCIVYFWVSLLDGAFCIIVFVVRRTGFH